MKRRTLGLQKFAPPEKSATSPLWAPPQPKSVRRWQKSAGGGWQKGMEDGRLGCRQVGSIHTLNLLSPNKKFILIGSNLDPTPFPFPSFLTQNPIFFLPLPVPPRPSPPLPPSTESLTESLTESWTESAPPPPLVSIIMGSDSDLKVMKSAAQILDSFSVPYEVPLSFTFLSGVDFFLPGVDFFA